MGYMDSESEVQTHRSIQEREGRQMSEYNPSAKQQWTPIKPSPAPVETQEKGCAEHDVPPGYGCSVCLASDPPEQASESELPIPDDLKECYEACVAAHNAGCGEDVVDAHTEIILIERIARLEQEVSRLKGGKS